MITGVRLTQLAHGEPLLGSSWNYKNLHGIQAVEERLGDLFSTAKYLGFNFIIDTIKPQIDASGNLHFKNNGINGDKWSFERRMELYRLYKAQLGLELLIEVEFPTSINKDNWEKYANFFANDIVNIYGGVGSDEIRYWQVVVTPEEQDVNGNYKCDPESYVSFLKHIEYLKVLKPGIQFGGPGSFQAVIDYINNKPDNWLSKAIGEVYKSNQPEYAVIGNAGFLPYINFFSFHGKQNIESLNYSKYGQIINTLDISIKQKIDKSIPIFSTLQGWAASSEDNIALEEQGYYEIREILNAVKYGVVPFKNQLVDEYDDPTVWNGKYDPNNMNYGLLNYFLGEKGFKPACNEYYFVLKNLEGFNTVTTDINLYETNPNVDSVTLINFNGDKTATVIWPKKNNKESVFLKPHYARQYILPNGIQSSLTDTTEVVFDKFNFVIVYQMVDQGTLNISLLEKNIGRKLEHTENTLTHLVNLLPDSYNKEVKDVNYYKLLRSLALEMADAKVEIEELKDNLYLDTAVEENIYNNFGVLINLKKRPEWSYEKYRRLVKGVTKSLLEGPSPTSIIEAIKLFTNFNVNIYELYKNHKHIDPAILKGVNPQFAFVVEIEKPLDISADQESIYRDTNYVINIVKPAHTISLTIITLAGKEDYKEHFKNKYGKSFESSDEMQNEICSNIDEGIFGWRAKNYVGQLKTANTSIITNNSLTNGGLLTGPRYVLYDDSHSHLNLNSSEEFKEVMSNIDSCLNYNLYEKYNKIKEDIFSNFSRDLNEYKFGLNYNALIQLNGGRSKYNILSNNLKTLNNYKLAISSKLEDKANLDMEIGKYGDFLTEKWKFNNLLNAFSFNTKPGFTSGKFSFSNDITTRYDVDFKIKVFKKTVINLKTGKEVEISSIKELLEANIEGNVEEINKNILDIDFSQSDLIYGENNILPDINSDVYYIDYDLNEIYSLDNEQTIINMERVFNDCVAEYLENLNSCANLPLIDEYYTENINELSQLDVSEKEKYHNILDHQITKMDVVSEDKLRTIELGPVTYHVHKKLTQVFTNSSDSNIYVHKNDTFLSRTNELDSLTKVYVNGVLVPYWNYEEIRSNVDNTRSVGIKFINNFEIYPGDVVNIMYLKDREIIVGDFPIEEKNYENIIFGEKNEIWKTVDIIDDKLIINYEHNDKFKKPQENLYPFKVSINNSELYVDKYDEVTFEGSEFIEINNWNRSVSKISRLTLNISKLNKSMMYGVIQDNGQNIEVALNEINIKPEENICSNITLPDLSDKITIPETLYTFSGGFEEDNVAVILKPIDSAPDITMIPNEYYYPKDDYITTKIIDLYNYEKYNIKEMKDWNHYISGVYNDIFQIAEIKDANSFGMLYNDIFNSIMDEFNNQITIFSNENYCPKMELLHHDIILPINNDYVNFNLIEKTEYELLMLDKINTINTTCVFSHVSYNYEVFNKENISDNINNYGITNVNQIHTMQDNLYNAFKFGSGMFNLSKLVYKPIVDILQNEIEYQENTKPFNETVDVNISLNETKFNNVNDNHSSILLKNCSEKYNNDNLLDILLTRKIEHFIYEEYVPKKTECHLEMYKIVSNEKQIIKISTA